MSDLMKESFQISVLLLRRSSGGSSASSKATEVTARLTDARKFTGTQKFKRNSKKDGRDVPAHKLLAYLYKSTKSSDWAH